MKVRVATLAVGTEVTDGQIVDRNSAILSQLSFDLGFQVVEHRAVPDDRQPILQALKDLGSRVEILFVTGGLGPTSDDFTRELIAEFVGSKLVYNEKSWDHVVETLNARGVQPREIQKQQCYFPVGATVHKNPAGTANAFSLSHKNLKIFALPGPPSEIIAVWNDSVAKILSSLVPESERTKLHIWRCLGRGESDIAELAEPIVKQFGLLVGYRAHAPYVEVKVWSRPGENNSEAFAKLDQVLEPYLVNRDGEDIGRDFLKASAKFPSTLICDTATVGFLSDRLFTMIRSEKLESNIAIKTSTAQPVASTISSALEITLTANPKVQNWVLTINVIGHEVLTTKITPIYNHKVESERGRKYITEKALQIAVSTLAKR